MSLFVYMPVELPIVLHTISSHHSQSLIFGIPFDILSWMLRYPLPPPFECFSWVVGYPLPAIRYSFLDLNGEIPSPYYDIKDFCKKTCKNAITIDVTFKNASWNCNFERCCSFRCVVVAIYWFWPPSASIQGYTLLNGGTPPPPFERFLVRYKGIS